MNYIMAVDSFKCLDHASAEELGLFFTEGSILPLFYKMVAEITAQEQIHDQVKVLYILKSIVHIHDEF